MMANLLRQNSEASQKCCKVQLLESNRNKDEDP